MGNNTSDKERFKLLKKRNKSIMEKVKEWQSFPYVKPLICKECDSLAKLEPKFAKYKVVLKCPDCGSIQYYIPKPVLQTSLKIPAVLIKNQARHSVLSYLENTNEQSSSYT